MHVERLAASGFRNLLPLDLEVTADPVVLIGPNAQGKTNVLEALDLCATGRSFRNASPAELVKHGDERAELRSRLTRHGVRHDIVVRLDSERRLVEVDGRALRQASRLLQIVNIISFFPDDLRIAKGSPEERRRFLDRAIANHRPEFIEAALAYAKALKSRNSLLRAPGRLDRGLVEVYDEQLVRYGTVTQRCREETLEGLAPRAKEQFADLMGHGTEVRFELVSGVPESPSSQTGAAALPQSSSEPARDSFATAFAAALVAAFPKDRARGMTTVGPHRGDLRILINGRDARLFASQGQQRSVVLALKLAELAYLEEKIGSAPILLLDDVSSELDQERTRQLFAALAVQRCQSWVTTTGATPLPLPSSSQLFSLNNGELARLSTPPWKAL